MKITDKECIQHMHTSGEILISSVSGALDREVHQ